MPVLSTLASSESTSSGASVLRWSARICCASSALAAAAVAVTSFSDSDAWNFFPRPASLHGTRRLRASSVTVQPHHIEPHHSEPHHNKHHYSEPHHNERHHSDAYYEKEHHGAAYYMFKHFAMELAVPDIVGTANDTEHGHMQVEMAHLPDWFPTAEQLSDYTPAETEQRSHFWISCFFFTHIGFVIVGTGILFLGSRLKQQYDNAARTYTLLPQIQQTSSSTSTEQLKKLTGVCFASTVVASISAVLYSMKTRRLSKLTGLNFEFYYGLYCLTGFSMLMQAAGAVRKRPVGQLFPASTFVASSSTGMLPVLSDAYDTLKDTILGGLMLLSEHLVLKILGILSWCWLIGAHLYFLMDDDGAMEMSQNYIPVYTAQVTATVAQAKTVAFESGKIGITYDSNGKVTEVNAGGQAAKNGIKKENKILYVHDDTGVYPFSMDAVNDAENTGNSYKVIFEVAPQSLIEKRLLQPVEKFWKEFLVTVYKQTTPTKIKVLIWEALVQAFMAMFYLLLEGGSLWVGVVNLMIPAVQLIVALFLSYRMLRFPQVREWIEDQYILAHHDGIQVKKERFFIELQQKLSTIGFHKLLVVVFDKAVHGLVRVDMSQIKDQAEDIGDGVEGEIKYEIEEQLEVEDEAKVSNNEGKVIVNQPLSDSHCRHIRAALPGCTQVQSMVFAKESMSDSSHSHLLCGIFESVDRGYISVSLGNEVGTGGDVAVEFSESETKEVSFKGVLSQRQCKQIQDVASTCKKLVAVKLVKENKLEESAMASFLNTFYEQSKRRERVKLMIEGSIAVNFSCTQEHFSFLQQATTSTTLPISDIPERMPPRAISEARTLAASECDTGGAVAAEGGDFNASAVYTIENVQAEGKFLHVHAASTDTGASIQLWNDPDRQQSQWRIARKPNGTYTIENVNAMSKFLHVVGRSTDKGASIDLWDDPAHSETQWYIVQISSGIYTIENANAKGKYLCVHDASTDNQANVQLWDDPDSPQTQWRIAAKAEDEMIFEIGHEQAHKFKPGRMGVEFEEEGVVKKVEKDGQADVLGIQRGDKIVKFALDGAGEQAYSQNALINAETGTSGYTVTFLVNESFMEKKIVISEGIKALAERLLHIRKELQQQNALELVKFGYVPPFARVQDAYDCAAAHVFVPGETLRMTAEWEKLHAEILATRCFMKDEEPSLKEVSSSFAPVLHALESAVGAGASNWTYKNQNLLLGLLLVENEADMELVRLPRPKDCPLKLVTMKVSPPPPTFVKEAFDCGAVDVYIPGNELFFGTEWLLEGDEAKLDPKQTGLGDQELMLYEKILQTRVKTDVHPKPLQAPYDFKSGELGISCDINGVVIKVTDDGQAHKKGITEGMRIVKIPGHTRYSEAALKSAETSGLNYQVVFEARNRVKSAFKPRVKGLDLADEAGATQWIYKPDVESKGLNAYDLFQTEVDLSTDTHNLLEFLSLPRQRNHPLNLMKIDSAYVDQAAQALEHLRDIYGPETKNYAEDGQLVPMSPSSVQKTSSIACTAPKAMLDFVLNGSQMRVDDFDFKTVVDALPSNTQKLRLVLSFSKVSDDGIKHFANNIPAKLAECQLLVDSSSVSEKVVQYLIGELRAKGVKVLNEPTNPVSPRAR